MVSGISTLVAFFVLIAFYITKQATLWLFFLLPLLFSVIYFVSGHFSKTTLPSGESSPEKQLAELPEEAIPINEDEQLEKKITEGNTFGDIWNNKQVRELERLKDLERYRKEFVGNVSHELKTPIFNIQGYILTLMEGGIEDSKINKLYLERTEKNIDRMISIVQDLEAINKLESGELKLNFEDFDIVRMVEDVFELEHRMADENRITLEFGNKPLTPLMVRADKKRITEVLTNLVVNSIKYGKKNGMVWVSFYESGEKLVVEVQDNGIGISKKDLPRIFERFYRVDKSRSREQGGTGLGLSIVKHIIEAHSQTINVKSSPDQGTTFTFTVEKTK
jgi:two-component system phosphate regulon sensor histidine kinase PhoR